MVRASADLSCYLQTRGALAGVAFALMLAVTSGARAQLSVVQANDPSFSNNNAVGCATNQTCTTTNTQSTDASNSTARFQTWDSTDPANVTAFVGTAATVNGAGLAIGANSGATITLTNSGSISISSGVTSGGSAALNINGAGAAVTYSGAGRINNTGGGDGLDVSNTGIGTSTITVSAGGSISGNNGIGGSGLTIVNVGSIKGNASTNPNAILFGGGSNSLTTNGGTYTGAINIPSSNSGTLTLLQTAAGGATGSATYSNVIAGAGKVVVDTDSGYSVTFSVANTYSGGTTVTSGSILNLSNSTGGGTGGITMDAGSTLGLNNVAITNTVSGSGDPTMTVTGASSMPTFTGGAGTTFNILGTDNSAATDVLTVTTTNATFAGTTNVGGTAAGSSVTLKGGATSAFGAISSVAVFTGSALDLGGFDQAIGSLSGGGTVTNSGASGTNTLTIGGGTATTFSGIIADGATAVTALTLSNSGTSLTVTDVSTYSGATTINSGATLALSGNGSISSSSSVTANGTFDISGSSAPLVPIKTLAGSGTVQLGAHGLVITAGSTTFSGSIQDGGNSGGIEIFGGTQTLSGNNTYTNDTQIDSGATLALKGTGSIADSFFVRIVGTGNFDISQTTAGASVQGLFGSGTVSLGSQTLTIGDAGTAYSGVIQDGGIISGTGGSIVVAAFGDQQLGGVNTYTGLTTINANGELDLIHSGTHDGSIASSSGVVDNGTFDISALSSGTSIKSLSGSGNVFLGGHTLTLSNASGTFSGSLQDGGNNGGSGGALTLASGTETLSGTSTYTGATTINGGTLDVTGSITGTSGVTVNAGGTLTGTGTVDPPTTTIASGATFTPGTAGVPGTSMTIAGNLAFQSGANYQIYLNPATSSFANVTGTAALAGTVNASFAAGSYLTKQHTILESTGLGGTTFAALSNTNLPAGFADKLSYTADNVLLNLAAVLPTTGVGRNQGNVAAALNNFFNSGGTLPPQFVNLFNLTGAQLAQALAQLDGEAATGAATSTFQLVNDFFKLVSEIALGNGGGGTGTNGGASGFAEPDEALPPDLALAYNALLKKALPAPQQNFEQRWTAWGSGFGGAANYDGNAVIGSSNLNASDYGYAGGMDLRATPNLKLGFALAGAGTNWSLAQNLGSGRSDSFQAAGYAIEHFGALYLSGTVGIGNSWFTTNRIAALGDQLRASFDGQTYALRGEAGYRYAVAPLAGLSPYAAIQTQWLHLPGYSETDLTGGGFGLSYAAQTANDTRSELGARADDLTMLGTLPLILRGRLAWAHDWLSNAAVSAAFQAMPGAAFTVNGAAVPKNSALTTAAAQLYLTANLSLEAKFDGEFAASAQTYAGSGTLRYAW